MKNFLADESGASAAEYALILAVVGVAIGGAALLLAGEIGTAITESATRVNDCAEAAKTNATSGTCVKPAAL
ncbi:MAG: Flp family type IVb pilin [Sphingomonadales bacterium]|nr:Flp family type IVb pilin [Sphingomonadales bacterium]